MGAAAKRALTHTQTAEMYVHKNGNKIGKVTAAAVAKEEAQEQKATHSFRKSQRALLRAVSQNSLSSA